VQCRRSRLEQSDKHAQDTIESPTSSVNAHLHKFRWIHVPARSTKGDATCLGRPVTAPSNLAP